MIETIKNGTDKCPVCKTGTLVFSENNITLRIGTRMELWYCLSCKKDTGKSLK